PKPDRRSARRTGRSAGGSFPRGAPARGRDRIVVQHSQKKRHVDGKAEALPAKQPRRPSTADFRMPPFAGPPFAVFLTPALWREGDSRFASLNPFFIISDYGYS